MKNSEYWKRRFELLEATSHKEAAFTYQKLENQFIKAQRELEAQIQTWYSRFASNNQISMAEARRLLTTKELAEFRWDVNEYIKYGQKNALNGKWMKELENASARFHISRIESLKLQTQQTMEIIFGNQTDSIDNLMKRTYLNGYYHTSFEVQKGVGVGWDIAAVDDGNLQKILSKPWTTDNRTFSDRIWQNKTGLINEVHTQLTQNIILGKSPDDAIKAISAKFNTSKNNAGRLVMTESAYFSSLSQKDAFNELDVERFEVVETLDGHTCPVCGAMDGQVFDMKDFEPGVTAPPYHPWCRGCTAPFFDDSFGERAARGEDGKTYYIPASMTYKEWEEKYVKSA